MNIGREYLGAADTGKLVYFRVIKLLGNDNAKSCYTTNMKEPAKLEEHRSSSKTRGKNSQKPVPSVKAKQLSLLDVM